MTFKFKLKNLAETIIESITCPHCKAFGEDEEYFICNSIKVTLEGIAVSLKCNSCDGRFVPKEQRLGIVNCKEFTDAVLEDSFKTGQPVITSFKNFYKSYSK